MELFRKSLLLPYTQSAQWLTTGASLDCKKELLTCNGKLQVEQLQRFLILYPFITQKLVENPLSIYSTSCYYFHSHGQYFSLMAEILEIFQQDKMLDTHTNPRRDPALFLYTLKTQ